MQPKINLIYSDTVDGISVNNDLYCKLSSDENVSKNYNNKFNNHENVLIVIPFFMEKYRKTFKKPY